MTAKMQNPKVSFRIDPELKARLDSIARATNTDRTEVINYAIEVYLKHADETGKIEIPASTKKVKK